jgi:uncharacterized protein
LPTFSRSQLLLTLAITAVALLAIAQIWRSVTGIDLAFQWSWFAFVEGIGLGCFLSGCSFALYQLWPAYRESAVQYMQLIVAPLQMGDWLWIGLLPGLSEELMFRGVMLPSWGLVPTSLLFGALHVLDWRQWPYALWTTIIGLSFGVATLVSGNLLVAVTAHVVVNWISCWVWGRMPREA